MQEQYFSPADSSTQSQGGWIEMSKKDKEWIIHYDDLPESVKVFYCRMGIKSVWFSVNPTKKSPAEKFKEVMKE